MRWLKAILAFIWLAITPFEQMLGWAQALVLVGGLFGLGALGRWGPDIGTTPGWDAALLYASTGAAVLFLFAGVRLQLRVAELMQQLNDMAKNTATFPSLERLTAYVDDAVARVEGAAASARYERVHFTLGYEYAATVRVHRAANGTATLSAFAIMLRSLPAGGIMDVCYGSLHVGDELAFEVSTTSSTGVFLTSGGEDYQVTSERLAVPLRCEIRLGKGLVASDTKLLTLDRD